MPVPHDVTIQLNLHDILIWALVGLVAGFVASRVMLGHSLGIIADIVVGILGAILGNVVAAYFGVTITVVGHPIISEILIAFFGALVLLLALRLVGFGRRRRTAL